MGFPVGSVSKESTCNAGEAEDSSSNPGERHSNALQYSCFENPMQSGAWQATVHRVTKSQIYWSDSAQVIIFKISQASQDRQI